MRLARADLEFLEAEQPAAEFAALRLASRRACNPHVIHNKPPEYATLLA